MKYIGISCHDESSPRGILDRKKLKKMGFSGFDVIIGNQDLVEFFDNPLSLREGVSLVIPSCDSLAVTAHHRENRLRKSAAAGVPIRIGDGEPILYDSDDKIAEFRAGSVKAQRAADARQRAASGRVGRPPQVKITEQQKAAVCAVWWDDRRDGGPRAVELAKVLTGNNNITLSHVKNWCSPTRKKPDEETPLELDE